MGKRRLLWLAAGGAAALSVDELMDGGRGSHPGGFPSYEETFQALDRLESLNPLILSRVPIGLSYECRVMWGYMVSADAIVDATHAANRTGMMQYALIRSIGQEEDLEGCMKATWLDDRGRRDLLWLGAHMNPAKSHFELPRDDGDTVVEVGQQSTASSTRLFIRRRILSTELFFRRAILQPVRRVLRVLSVPARLYQVPRYPIPRRLESTVPVKAPPRIRGFRLVGPRAVNATATLREARPVPVMPDRSVWLSDINLFDDATGKILMTALHHAREPASLTATFTVFEKIVTSLNRLILSYGKQRKAEGLWGVQGYELKLSSTYIPALMSRRHLVYVPFINPDGYVAIERTGNRMVRKNQRRTCIDDSTRETVGVNGVDLNRNYDSAFVREHAACHAEEYEGEYPFSEPETRAMRRLVRLYKPDIALNFHAYGDLWTRPWNCCHNKTMPETAKQIFEEISAGLGPNIPFGSALELPQLGYAATGEADDWIMDQFGTISMSPEVGPEQYEFYPPKEIVKRINRENFGRTLFVMSKAGPELNLSIEPCGPVPKVSIFNTGLKASGPIAVFVSPSRQARPETTAPPVATEQSQSTDGAGIREVEIQEVEAMEGQRKPRSDAGANLVIGRQKRFKWRGDTLHVQSFEVDNVPSRSVTEMGELTEVMTNLASTKYQVCMRSRQTPFDGCACAMVDLTHDHLNGGGIIIRSSGDLGGAATNSTSICESDPGSYVQIPLSAESTLPPDHPCYHLKKLRPAESVVVVVDSTE